MKNTVVEWLIRFVKGIFIGTGFIFPGVSGGALAAIFGLYERMIEFMANITKNIKENILFFLPVGLGALIGIVVLTYPLEYCLNYHYETTMWLFVGTIIGTFPSLWKQAEKKGRNQLDIIVMVIAFLISVIFLKFGAELLSGSIPQNYITWTLAGVIIALGILIPGLSPSNFLLYMGMYGTMILGFKQLNFSILVPIAIGGILCILILSKGIDFLFKNFYSRLFHIIIGVVLASTVMIIPIDYNYFSIGIVSCIIACIAGIVLGYWMSGLEEKYKS